MNKHTLNELSNHIVFLHGISGAGKSVLQNKIESELKSKGLPVLYLSSGDCFRELTAMAASNKNSEIAKKMASGKFIATLEDVMPILETKLTTFISELVSSEAGHGPVLILDGFLRIGEYQENGKRVPSQVEQIAGAFSRVIQKNGHLNDEWRGLFSECFNKIFSEVYDSSSNFDLAATRVFSCMVKDSYHYYVDVKDEDAEMLMRFRSEKALRDLINRLDGREGASLELRKQLETALLIQQGKFKVMEGSKRRVETDRDIASNFTLNSVPRIYEWSLDGRMREIIRNLVEIAGVDKDGEKYSFTSLVKKICREEKVDTQGVSLRDDDLTYRSRWSRIKEFKNKTVEGFLIGELGFEKDITGLLVSNEVRRGTIVNGPARDISYDNFSAFAEGAAAKIVGGINREVRIFGPHQERR